MAKKKNTSKGTAAQKRVRRTEARLPHLAAIRKEIAELKIRVTALETK